MINKRGEIGVEIMDQNEGEYRFERGHNDYVEYHKLDAYENGGPTSSRSGLQRRLTAPSLAPSLLMSSHNQQRQRQSFQKPWFIQTTLQLNVNLQWAAGPSKPLAECPKVQVRSLFVQLQAWSIFTIHCQRKICRVFLCLNFN